MKRALDQTRLRTGSRSGSSSMVGIAYVRSVRGVRGRWYREATAFPEVVVYAGKRRLPAHVEPVSDPPTIARVSEAFLHKYAQWPNDAHAMVRDEVLETTLRLHPSEAL